MSFPDKNVTFNISTTDYEQYTYGDNGNRTWLTKRDGLVIN
jgi:hypothetical protein